MAQTNAVSGNHRFMDLGFRSPFFGPSVLCGIAEVVPSAAIFLVPRVIPSVAVAGAITQPQVLATQPLFAENLHASAYFLDASRIQFGRSVCRVDGGSGCERR